MPREGGASSKPRPLGLIVGVSGILDHPPSRVMTSEHDPAFSPHACAKFCWKFPALIQRAQGIPGACCTHGLACKECMQDAHEHTGSAEAFRHSPRNGFTTYFVLSPVTGLVCHRHRRNCFRQLDTSVGVSGPHDFAVRLCCGRHCTTGGHRIRPRVNDVAQRPSSGIGPNGYISDYRNWKAEYFSRRDWTAQITLMQFSNLDFACKSLFPSLRAR
jgi:hypothetical protein